MFTHKLTDESELRPLETRHSEELFNLIDRNREYLREYLPWVDGTQSADDTRSFIKGQLHQHAENGTTVAGIWHLESIVGTVGLHTVGVKCMEIGYWIGEEFQGKGLVTAACQALISHAFCDLGITRVEIRAEPRNKRSRAIPERLGFTLEGTLRQKGMNAAGDLIDLMMYSLLKDDWDSRNCEH